MKYKTRLQLTILGITALIYSVSFTVFIFRYNSHAVREVKEKLISRVQMDANKIEAALNIDFGICRSLAASYKAFYPTDESLRWDYYKMIIKDQYYATKDYLSFWSSFELQYFQKGYEKNYGRRTITALEFNNKFTIYDLFKNMDGDIPGSSYAYIKSCNCEVINDPYFYSITEDGKNLKLITSVSIPINDDYGHYIGLAGVDVLMERYAKIADQAKPYSSSVPYMLSYGGFAITHPQSEMIGKNISEIWPELSKESDLISVIQQGKQLNKLQEEDGQKFMYTFAPITLGKTNTPWSLVSKTPWSEIVKDINRTILFMVLSGILALLLMMFIVNGVANTIVGFFSKIDSFTQELNNGNLAARIDISRNDEIGQIAISLNSMGESLRDLVGQIIETSDKISKMGRALQQSSSELSDSANTQAAALEEVASSMEELVSNIDSNTDNASKTEEIAKNTHKQIEVSTKATREAGDAISNITEKIGIVTDIASQTNLLALNAAVEAARAGEAGKGFSVVAGEVRNLAERSKEAADSINKLVKEIIATSVSANDKLAMSLPEVKKTTELIQEISIASFEQRDGSNQINESIQALNNNTQINAGHAEQLSLNAMELQQQSEKLSNLISRFKI